MPESLLSMLWSVLDVDQGAGVFGFIVCGVSTILLNSTTPRFP